MEEWWDQTYRPDGQVHVGSLEEFAAYCARHIQRQDKATMEKGKAHDNRVLNVQ